jgi:hypothetical protein
MKKEENSEENMAMVPVSKLQAAYNDADEDGKEMLCNLYGGGMFLNDYEKIKTFEDACKVTGDDPSYIEGITPKHLKAYAKLYIIAKALRGSWKPDWADFDQYKYFPWFKIIKKDASLCVGGADHASLVGLSCLSSNPDVSCTYADYGGALASESEEIAIYFGKQFSEIWKDYLLV